MPRISKMYYILACLLLMLGYSFEVQAATAPSRQARYLSSTSISTSGMTVSWVNGNGGKRMVVAYPANTDLTLTANQPANNTTYHAVLEGNYGASDANNSPLGVGKVIYVGSGSKRSIEVVALDAGTTYKFMVYEFNVGGTSNNPAYNVDLTAINNPRQFTTLYNSLTAPVIDTPVPTGSITANSAVITWDPIASANGYQLDLSTNTAFGPFVPGFNNLDIGDPGTGVSSRNFTLDGLAPNTTYYVRIRSYNTNATSGNSNVASFTTTDLGWGFTTLYFENEEAALTALYSDPVDFTSSLNGVEAPYLKAGSYYAIVISERRLASAPDFSIFVPANTAPAQDSTGITPGRAMVALGSYYIPYGFDAEYEVYGIDRTVPSSPAWNSIQEQWQISAIDLNNNATPANTIVENVTDLPYLDNVAPTVVTIDRLGATLTNQSSVQYAVTFSETVNNVSTGGFSVTSSNISSVSVNDVTGTGTNYTVTVGVGTNSNGTLALALHNNNGSITDRAGNTVSGLPYNALPFTIDNIPPTVALTASTGRTVSGQGATLYTNATSIDYVVTFNKSVTGVATSNFTVSGANITAGTVNNVSGSGSIYTVTVNGVTHSGANGTLVLTMANTTGVQDLAGNTISNLPAANTNTLVVDYVAPTIVSIDRSNPTGQYTNSTSWEYAITMSENIYSFSGSQGFTITHNVSGTAPGKQGGLVNGNTITLQGPTGTGNGTMRMDYSYNASAMQDYAGNTIAGTFTSGQVYDINKTNPAVSAITRLNASPTNNSSVSYQVTFTKDVSGVSASNFSLSGTPTGTLSFSSYSISNVNPSTGSNSVWTVTAYTGSGSGTLHLDFLANQTGITDQWGNGATATFTTGEEYEIDRFLPSVNTITYNDRTPTNATTAEYVVTFSKQVKGVTTSNFSVSLLDGTLTGYSITGATAGSTLSDTWSVTLATGAGSLGTLRVDLNNAIGITDNYGNTLTGTRDGDNTIPIDRVAPSVSSISRLDNEKTNASSVRYAVTFTRPVYNVQTSNFSVTSNIGATLNAVSGSGSLTTWTVSVNTGNSTADGTLRLDLTAPGTGLTGIYDVPQNNLSGTNIPFNGDVYDIDKNAPTISSFTLTSNSPTNSSNATYAVTFSKPVNTFNYNYNISLICTGASPTGKDATVTPETATLTYNTNYTITATTGTQALQFTMTPHISNFDPTSMIRDEWGNAANFTGALGTGPACEFDRVGASITSINRVSPTQQNINNDEVIYLVTFDEAVNTVSSSNFSINTTGSLAGYSVSSVVGESSSTMTNHWSVTVNTGTGDGTLRLDLANNTGIKDQFGNDLTHSTYTTGQTYIIDRTAPTVSTAVPTPLISGRSEIDPQLGLQYIITFDEEIASIGAGNISLTCGTVTYTYGANNTLYVAHSGSSMTVTPGTNDVLPGNSTVTFNIDSDVMKDAVGNSNAASTTITFITVDRAPVPVGTASIRISGRTVATMTLALSHISGGKSIIVGRQGTSTTQPLPIYPSNYPAGPLYDYRNDYGFDFRTLIGTNQTTNLTLNFGNSTTQLVGKATDLLTGTNPMKVVYAGTQTTITVTGLAPAMQYTFAIIPYNLVSTATNVDASYNYQYSYNHNTLPNKQAYKRTARIIEENPDVEESGLDANLYVSDISPNPVVNNLNFKFDILEASNLTVDVVNANGQVVYTFMNNVPYNAGTFNLSLPMVDIPSGAYMLRVSTNNEVMVKKFVFMP